MAVLCSRTIAVFCCSSLPSASFISRTSLSSRIRTASLSPCACFSCCWSEATLVFNAFDSPSLTSSCCTFIFSLTLSSCALDFHFSTSFKAWSSFAWLLASHMSSSFFITFCCS